MNSLTRLTTHAGDLTVTLLLRDDHDTQLLIAWAADRSDRWLAVTEAVLPDADRIIVGASAFAHGYGESGTAVVSVQWGPVRVTVHVFGGDVTIKVYAPNLPPVVGDQHAAVAYGLGAPLRLSMGILPIELSTHLVVTKEATQ